MDSLFLWNKDRCMILSLPRIVCCWQRELKFFLKDFLFGIVCVSFVLNSNIIFIVRVNLEENTDTKSNETRKGTKRKFLVTIWNDLFFSKYLRRGTGLRVDTIVYCFLFPLSRNVDMSLTVFTLLKGSSKVTYIRNLCQILNDEKFIILQRIL